MKDILSDPRYAANPSDYFFELFVIDTIKPLPPEEQERIAATIEAQSDSWRDKVKNILKLNDTIEVAILDLWYRNSEIAKEKKERYPVAIFARDFVDHYWEDNSQIDVWGPGALEAAQARIKLASGKPQ